jgi:hypothetical protein
MPKSCHLAVRVLHQHAVSESAHAAQAQAASAPRDAVCERERAATGSSADEVRVFAALGDLVRVRQRHAGCNKRQRALRRAGRSDGGCGQRATCATRGARPADAAAGGVSRGGRRAARMAQAMQGHGACAPARRQRRRSAPARCAQRGARRMPRRRRAGSARRRQRGSSALCVHGAHHGRRRRTSARAMRRLTRDARPAGCAALARAAWARRTCTRRDGRARDVASRIDRSIIHAFRTRASPAHAALRASVGRVARSRGAHRPAHSGGIGIAARLSRTRAACSGRRWAAGR